MHLPDLLHKLANNEASELEINAFSAHLATLSREEYEQLLEAYGDIVKNTSITAAPDKELFASIQDRIINYEEQSRSIPATISLKPLANKRRWLYYPAAAAILIAVLIGTYFLADRRSSVQPIAATTTPAIPPGSNKAVLTLANGQQLLLDDAKQGNIASQNGVKIIKLDSGLLAYHDAAAAGGQTLYNTITTPRGGQYQLVLPDGTHAWLNAASSLRFPISFNGPERKVELTGEGYFAVARDAAHPFIVSFKHTQVEVLGTEFNIMAYDDEPATQTTLVSGSVRLANGAQLTLLQPGKMALVATAQPRQPVQVITADVEQVTAWKNGKLSLANADLAAVMRQLSRWYDINVHYAGAVPDKHFFGSINRNVYLASILAFLKNNGIRVTQEGRDITILP